jgi:NAD(P)-dependent dehydrogenase (short-subunit alcohol dehydrogenase family)
VPSHWNSAARAHRDRYRDQRAAPPRFPPISAKRHPGLGVLNVTDSAASDACSPTWQEFGAITVLVNNAGITRDNLAMRMGDDEWEAVIDTNLKAVFRCRVR